MSAAGLEEITCEEKVYIKRVVFVAVTKPDLKIIRSFTYTKNSILQMKVHVSLFTPISAYTYKVVINIKVINKTQKDINSIISVSIYQQRLIRK